MSLAALRAPVQQSYCQKVLIAALGRTGLRSNIGCSSRTIRRISRSSSATGRSASFRCWSTTASRCSKRRCIIEHLQLHHPGPNALDPGRRDGRRARFLDRFFDLYIMGTCSRGQPTRCGPRARATLMAPSRACKTLHIAYDWLEAQSRPTANGRSATHSRSPTAPLPRPYSMRIGSKRSAIDRPRLEGLSRAAARPSGGRTRGR